MNTLMKVAANNSKKIDKAMIVASGGLGGAVLGGLGGGTIGAMSQANKNRKGKKEDRKSLSDAFLSGASKGSVAGGGIGLLGGAMVPGRDFSKKAEEKKKSFYQRHKKKILGAGLATAAVGGGLLTKRHLDKKKFAAGAAKFKQTGEAARDSNDKADSKRFSKSLDSAVNKGVDSKAWTNMKNEAGRPFRALDSNGMKADKMLAEARRPGANYEKVPNR